MNEQQEELQEELTESAMAGQSGAAGSDEELSPEDMAQLYEETFQDTKEGAVVKGKVSPVLVALSRVHPAPSKTLRPAVLLSAPTHTCPPASTTSEVMMLPGSPSWIV